MSIRSKFESLRQHRGTMAKLGASDYSGRIDPHTRKPRRSNERNASLIHRLGPFRHLDQRPSTAPGNTPASTTAFSRRYHHLASEPKDEMTYCGPAAVTVRWTLFRI